MTHQKLDVMNNNEYYVLQCEHTLLYFCKLYNSVIKVFLNLPNYVRFPFKIFKYPLQCSVTIKN